jgi:hypothetical protein
VSAARGVAHGHALLPQSFFVHQAVIALVAYFDLSAKLFYGEATPVAGLGDSCAHGAKVLKICFFHISFMLNVVK